MKLHRCHRGRQCTACDEDDTTTAPANGKASESVINEEKGGGAGSSLYFGDFDGSTDPSPPPHTAKTARTETSAILFPQGGGPLYLFRGSCEEKE
jgi:hypothetical protein